tara:strand:- start:310 stop:558 length:249 start_codon:yes stop_codon:yes gene_type:complete
MKVSKNHMKIVSNMIVFNPPNKNPRNLSIKTNENDLSKRNRRILVRNLEIIIEIKNINPAERRKIHLVSISKKDDKRTVKSK